MTTNTNCPVTAGRATAIHTGLPRQAPVRPKNACDRLSTNARMREKTPNSGAIARCSRLGGRPAGGRTIGGRGGGRPALRGLFFSTEGGLVAHGFFLIVW